MKSHEAIVKGLLGAVNPELLEEINALGDAEAPAELIDRASNALADWHFANDKTRIEAVRKDNSGRTYSLVQQRISKMFGVSAKELEGKPIEDWLTAAATKIKADAGMNDDERTRALESLKTTVSEYEAKIAQYDSEVIPGLKAEADNRIKRYRLDEQVTGLIMKNPLNGPSQYVVPGLMNKLSAKYNIDFDEAENVVVTTKDGARIPKPGTKEFKSLEELILEEGTADGAFAKSNGGTQGNGNPPPAGNGKPVPPAPPKQATGTMTEAQRNIEIAKQKMTAGQ